MSLILSASTKKIIDQILVKPSHAIMLIAPEGSGKASVVYYLAQNLLNLRTKKELINYPYLSEFKPVKDVITIDNVREMIAKTRLTTTGEGKIRRIIYIEDAHKMGHEAQNALLKLLEEPPKDTCLILTVSDKKLMLPTVVSRVTSITINLPKKEQLDEHFKKLGYSAQQIEKNYLLSRGRPGVYTALLTDDQEHPLVQSISNIKNLLSMTTNERLIFIDKPEFKNVDLAVLLDGFISICSVAISQASEKNNKNDIKRWLNLYKIACQTYDVKSAHPNTNLLFSNLVLSM